MAKYRERLFWLGLLLYLAVLIFLVAWGWERGTARHPYDGWGALAGLIGFTSLAVAFFLASRAKFMEKIFGGLDRIYRLHHRIGLVGFGFLCVHPFLYALRQPHHYFEFLLPIHRRLSVNLGIIAFTLLLLIIVVTLLKILPYDKWKWVHRAMSVVFVLASLHILLSDHLFGYPVLTRILLALPMAMGFWGILYKQLYLSFLAPRPRYQVRSIDRVSSRALAVALEPIGSPLDYVPGQYAFFSFRGQGFGREFHPFTLMGDLSILVKARGDFTRALYDRLKVGDEAQLEGPYGVFDFRRGSERQIWIGGGVGIAPFLAWLEHAPVEYQVDLYYSVHCREDAVQVDKLTQLAQKRSEFRFVLICSEEEGHLTSEQVIGESPHWQESTIFLCGPKTMTRDLRRQFRRHGVARNQIVFEDFAFY